jgi:hypothetical protein
MLVLALKWEDCDRTQIITEKMVGSVGKHYPVKIQYLDYNKGQLISKCPFGVFKSPKKTMIFFVRICALASKKTTFYILGQKCIKFLRWFLGKFNKIKSPQSYYREDMTWKQVTDQFKKTQQLPIFTYGLTTAL